MSFENLVEEIGSRIPTRGSSFPFPYGRRSESNDNDEDGGNDNDGGNENDDDWLYIIKYIFYRIH